MQDQVAAEISWGLKKRLEFIEEKLFWEGKVNRSDLTATFKISVPQASADLGKYQEIAPLALDYDRSGKFYYPTENFTPVFAQISSDNHLSLLHAISVGLVPRESKGISNVPPIGHISLPPRAVNPNVLKNILTAINCNQKLHITYQSMSGPQPKERWITPHALAFDDFRWHVRAYCHVDDMFKDFVLGRIIAIGDKKISAVDAKTDQEWHDLLTITIAPNPKLDEGRRKGIELDYGMTNGMLQITSRISLARYLLKRLGLHKATDNTSEVEQQIVLLNKEEVCKALHYKLGFERSA